MTMTPCPICSQSPQACRARRNRDQWFDEKHRIWEAREHAARSSEKWVTWQVGNYPRGLPSSPREDTLFKRPDFQQSFIDRVERAATPDKDVAAFLEAVLNDGPKVGDRMFGGGTVKAVMKDGTVAIKPEPLDAPGPCCCEKCVAQASNGKSALFRYPFEEEVRVNHQPRWSLQ